jgi:hypothetical protein
MNNELRRLFPAAYPIWLEYIKPLNENFTPSSPEELRLVDRFVGLCVREIAGQLEGSDEVAAIKGALSDVLALTGTEEVL